MAGVWGVKLIHSRLVSPGGIDGIEGLLVLVFLFGRGLCVTLQCRPGVVEPNTFMEILNRLYIFGFKMYHRVQVSLTVQVTTLNSDPFL